VNELTDLEICQRIAEIEGVTATVNVAIEAISNQKYNSIFNPNNITSPPTFGEIYNPLTDDDLCFKLMIKYKISLIQHQNNTAVYCIWDHDEKHATNTMTNPNRAICLAIIKSKE
jgi:hypothetical protein